MLRQGPRRIALLVALACELVLGTAFGESSEVCDEPRLSVLVPEDPRWSSATERLVSHLRGLSDLDRCARVTVRPDPTGVTVQITTADGRVAQRHVETVDDLLTATEALLVLPPTSRRSAMLSPLEVPPSQPKSFKSAPTSAHVELGAAGSLRFGGGPLYAGAGVAAFAGFALDSWLLTMTARLDAIDGFVTQRPPTDFTMQSAAVGVSAGRRLEIGQVSLDTLLGANVILESQDADDGDREIQGTSGDFRLGIALRVSGPRSASLRPFAVADFEGSPSRVGSKKYIDRSLPNLPWWSSGVAVGVLWGAQ
ncbi:MAG: hypothetical protein ABIQ16_28290 [Polyangiaceae bacterium]